MMKCLRITRRKHAAVKLIRLIGVDFPISKLSISNGILRPQIPRYPDPKPPAPSPRPQWETQFCFYFQSRKDNAWTLVQFPVNCIFFPPAPTSTPTTTLGCKIFVYRFGFLREEAPDYGAHKEEPCAFVQTLQINRTICHLWGPSTSASGNHSKDTLRKKRGLRLIFVVSTRTSVGDSGFWSLLLKIFFFLPSAFQKLC